MTISEFLILSSFSAQEELRRTLLIAFFNKTINGVASFKVADVCDWLQSLGYSRPNSSRLKSKLKKSRMFVAGTVDGYFKIHPATIESLDSEFPNLNKKSDDVVAFDSIIPENLLQKDRTYITSLIRQINSSYENNIFDGCAVLMRRLLEILLILAYEESGVSKSIKDESGNYKQLNSIIDDAKTNGNVGLSRGSKDSLEGFRKLGNFSAHKIFYNAHRSAIESVILDYKALIEELLYKGGLRT